MKSFLVAALLVAASPATAGNVGSRPKAAKKLLTPPAPSDPARRQAAREQEAAAGEHPWELVLDSERVYQVWISPPAPTRVLATLDGPKNAHVSLDFDPAQGGRMARSVPLTQGTWRVSLWAEPLLVTPAAPKEPRHYLVLFRPAGGDGDRRRYTGTPIDLYATAGERRSDLEFEVHLEPEPEPKVGEGDRLFTVSEPQDLGVRSLDQAIPLATNEIFQILAEIALERAESRGFALLSEKLSKWVCGDLTWNRIAIPGLEAVAARLKEKQAEQRMVASGGGSSAGAEPPAPPPPERRAPKAVGVSDARKETTGMTVAAEAAIAVAKQPGAAERPASTDAPAPGSGNERPPTDAPPKARANASADLTGDEEERVLPRTCEVVRGLRLQEIATSGRAFQRALSSDAAAFTAAIGGRLLGQVNASSAVGTAPYDELVAMLWPFLTRAVSQAPDSRDAQLLVLELSRWVHKRQPPAAEVTMELTVVLDSVAACQKLERCGPEDVVRILVEKDEGADAPKLAELSVLVSRVRDILSPPRGTTAKATALAAIDLVLDVAERARRKQCESGGGCSNDLALLAIDDLRTVARGLVEQDVQPVLVGTTALLGRLGDARADQCKVITPRVKKIGKKQKKSCVSAASSTAQECEDLRQSSFLACNSNAMPEVRRALQVVNAVASYASIPFEPSGDPKKVESERAARKKTVESLIDAMTDRRGRAGTDMFSLGANVGIGAAIENDASRGFGKLGNYGPLLEMPLGIAYQSLPSERSGDGLLEILRHPGFHAQLSVLDLGRFVPVSGQPDPTWSDVLYAGLQLGPIFGSGSNPFVLGIEVSARPVFAARGEDTTWPVRTGIFFSYYVPFLDLN